MINVKQAAELLSESVNKIRTLIKNGILKAEKVGRSYEIDEQSVDNYKNLAQQNDRKFIHKTRSNWGKFDQFPSVVKLTDDKATKFWNEHCETLSRNMPLLPTETSRVSNYITETKLQGEMPAVSAQIYAEPFMEYTKTETKSRAYRLYPQKEMKALWHMWMRETSRVYNFTLNLLAKLPDAKTIGNYTLRDLVKREINRTPTYPTYALEGAVNEALLAFNAGKAKERISGAFSIDGRCIQKGMVYPTNTKHAFGKGVKVESTRGLRQIKTKRTCKISFDSAKGCFFLHVPVNITPVSSAKKHFISLDPGIRTFMTYYDGESYGEIGAGFAKSLRPLMKAADKLNSKISETKNKRKKQIFQKAHNRITKKITNKVKDLHRQTAKFLGNYENIFLPEFRVKPLAEKLGHRTTRELYALSHFAFKQHLAFKTAELKNRVIICNEAYTSKTCTACGKIHPDLGANKLYSCACGASHDRDYNGARNIALRVLTYGLTHADHIN